MGEKPHTSVAVLGTGIMGSAIAGALLRAGFDVSVWNRTVEKANRPAAQGARVARSPAEAVRDVHIIITMLADAEATEQVMRGDDGALSATDPLTKPLWLQMATVGIEGGRRLAALAATHDLPFLEAPVVGTREPAERGELVALVSGPTALRERASSVLSALARLVIWTENPGESDRMKLVVNKWIIDLYESLAECYSFAEMLGCSPQLVVRALEGGPTWAPAASHRATLIASGDFARTSFSLKHALKDIDLILRAAEDAGAAVPFSRIVREQLLKGISAGHADDDIAALYVSLHGRTREKPDKPLHSL